MSRVYDNWEKLVGAVMRREKDRQLAYCDSLSTSSSSDFSSRFSFEIQFSEDQKKGQYSEEIKYSGAVRAIEYEEILRATRNFGPTVYVEKGRFTCAYKGWFDKQNPITIIKIDTDYINPHKWMDEIRHLRHPNLVTPIGYCFKRDQTFYVYEFMSEGSLYSQLFIRWWQQPLPWETRMKVAIGAAKGLAFLHSLEKPLIIGILGSANILLDDDFNAKLLDFGHKEKIPNPYMVDEVDYRFVPNANEYSAPEYKKAGILSTKCDVYSFGIVLYELITGRRALDINRPKTETYRIPWTNEIARSSSIMDGILEDQYRRKQARRIARLALRCLRFDPGERLEMTQVVAALQQLDNPTA